VTFAVDLAANPPILAKYIDGIKNLDEITGDRGHVDSSFALSIPEIVLFGDSDNENSDAYVSAIQVREGRMSDEEVAALGERTRVGFPLRPLARRPSVRPPPPRLGVSLAGASLTISWDASATGFTLESVSSLTAPVTWNPVQGVVNNSATVQIGAGTQFYRLRK